MKSQKRAEKEPTKQAVDKALRAKTAENIKTTIFGAASQLTVVRLALEGLAESADHSTTPEQDLRDLATTVEVVQQRLDRLNYLGLW